MSNSTSTFWGSACGSDLEEWAFWSEKVSWLTDVPDFTLCFETSILPWISTGFILLLCSLYIPSLRDRPQGVMAILIFLNCLDLVKSIVEAAQGSGTAAFRPILFNPPILGLIGMGLLLYVTRLEYLKGIHSSGCVFFIWLVQWLISTIIFRTKILLFNSGNALVIEQFRSITAFIAYPLIAINFIVNCFADRRAITHLLHDESLSRGLDRNNREDQPLLAFQGMDEAPRADVRCENRKVSKPRKICPELTASFLNRFTFHWLTPLIWQGYRRTVTARDLYDLRPEDTSEVVVPTVQKAWDQEVSAFNRKHQREPEAANGYQGYQELHKSDEYRNGKSSRHFTKTAAASRPSIFTPLGRVFGAYYSQAALCRLAFDGLVFVQPQILNLFIAFIGSKDPHVWHGYLIAFGLFLVGATRTMIFQNHWYINYTVGMRVRTGIIALIYRKAMRLSGVSRKDTTVGEIVNLMSVDAQKLNDVPGFLLMLFSTPLTIIVAIVFLWQRLGVAILAGLAFMTCLVPVNAFLATRQKKLQTAQMLWKDQRIKLMSEVLNGIKVLKMYAWEQSFQEKVNEIRQKELALLRSAAYIQAVTAISWFCAPFLMALSSFAAYTLSDPSHVMDANTAFVSLSLFNILNHPMTMLPTSIAQAIQAWVSLQRINKFLDGDEIDQTAVQMDPKEENPIRITNGVFSWGKNEPPILHDINLTVTQGSLVAVVGTVGSGKTSLMSALLGEMVRLQGRVHVRGSTAYVPQQAWCQNATLQNNILFDKPLNSQRYGKVLEACALLSDLKILPGGDQTEIGEKGINLSGGQKQRISLARAVYQNADNYFLDDPLSAVDSHVGKHIFEQVLGPKGMLQGRTRILITHGITYLPYVNKIIVLKDGRISEAGSYKELLSHNGAFAEFIRTYLDQAEEQEENAEDRVDDVVIDDESDATLAIEAEEEEANLRAQLRRAISTLSGVGVGDNERVSTAYFSHQVSQESEKRHLRRRTRQISRRNESMRETVSLAQAEAKRKLISEEVSATGSVKTGIFLIYLKAATWFIVISTVATYLLYMACSVSANLWLSKWTEVNGTQSAADRDYYLSIYGSFGAGQVVFSFLENFAIAVGTYLASTTLHDMILKKILKAPMNFFDTTPLGRIVNRFGKDIDTVDVNIPSTFRSWLATFAGVLASLVVISLASVYFLIALLPMGIVYLFVQRVYINTSRQLKRIDSVLRSPIYSHFQESIVGATTIRAYRRGDLFADKSDRLVDMNQEAWYPAFVSYRWLGVNLELIGNLVILLAGVFAILSRDSVGAGLAGLAVTYSLQITQALALQVRMSSDLESYGVAIERIEEYTTLETEAPWETEIRPSAQWPDRGQVEFRNYSVRYREGLDLVLRDIFVKINSGEKVGIVGRTGAGKSSLTLALFRILEPASGSIVIDGIDISRLGLHDLRSRITIIPQDPVIFSGTLRMNLDPFEQYNDGKLWTALEHSHLKQFVLNQAEGLNFMCSEGGDNLSVGQRQLLCLARALLRKTKILVLDEATAAVDLETDSLIQNTIRQEFHDCTVLTIAHRLNTIMDYDKVMILGEGRVREYDKPTELLKNENSIFCGMVKDAGLI